MLYDLDASAFEDIEGGGTGRTLPGATFPLASLPTLLAGSFAEVVTTTETFQGEITVDKLTAPVGSSRSSRLAAVLRLAGVAILHVVRRRRALDAGQVRRT